MKRLAKLMVVATLAISPFLVGASASAQQATCDIGYTGPDSQNMCTSTTTYRCSVTNTNTVTITNESGQTAASGTVNTSSNTTGGGAYSGTVTNTNGTTFTVNITNAAPESEEPGICTATVIVPATVTPETPGEVLPASTGGGAVEALPVTSADTTLQTTALIASVLLLAAGLSAGGVLWYRHAKLQ